MKLPPGVSQSDFTSALSQFQSIVGKEWVFTSDDDMDMYRDAYSPFYGEQEERVASAAVAPSTVEQVQAVVRAANQFKIPIYPISTGKNLTYGGSAPAYSGSVVLDLKRMNRVLEVSEENASALVEPGVSYFDLYRHIREKKLKLWIDVPDPGWGSPLGNALDHGGGYTAIPYRDHFDAHCGMEVVLANGELVRTGMGALPGAKTWQQFKYGLGPIVDGLFAQSNFGVVTKMGFWLMPEPESALTATVTVPRHDDLIALTDTLISLIYSGHVRSQTQLGGPLPRAQPDAELATLRTRWDDGRAQAFDAYAQRKGLHVWEAPMTFYGPEKIIRATLEYVKERFAKIPGVGFEELPLLKFPLSDEQLATVADKSRLGIPNLAFFASRYAPGAPPLEGHMDFSPIVPMQGKELLRAMALFGKVFAEAGVMPLGGVPQFYHTRTCTIIYAVPTSRDAAFNKKARDTFSKLMDVAAANGWNEYRLHPAFMEKGVGLMSFNNHSLLRLHETLKDAVDPNGILSAGRYGIWPKHLRKERT